jgi:AcrR family transcriptional regulator
VLELLADGNSADTISIEAVAAHAGVGKATIYRRWPGKEQLASHAVATVTEIPMAGRLPGPMREDLVTLLERMQRKHAATMVGRLITRLVGESPELMRCYCEQVIEPRRARLLGRLQQAVDEGELRPDVNLEDLNDALLSPVMYGVLVGRSARVQGRAYVERIVDLVLQGAATPSG